MEMQKSVAATPMAVYSPTPVPVEQFVDGIRDLAQGLITKQTIYATFTIDPNTPSNGYVQGKWYSNGTFAFSSKILAVQPDFLGYLSAEYNIATKGTVELYWCVQSDCSDAKLADVVNFTVTASSIHGTPPPALAFMDINRP